MTKNLASISFDSSKTVFGTFRCSECRSHVEYDDIDAHISWHDYLYEKLLGL